MNDLEFIQDTKNVKQIESILTKEINSYQHIFHFPFQRKLFLYYLVEQPLHTIYNFDCVKSSHLPLHITINERSVEQFHIIA